MLSGKTAIELEREFLKNNQGEAAQGVDHVPEETAGETFERYTLEATRGESDDEHQN